MNYFGHAAVATLCGRSSRFVLGAMLPDLMPMAGILIPKDMSDRDLSDGLLFHLETDALFHNTRTFLELNRKALSDLRSLGVSRGPARACAHIGVEMRLDAVLAESDASFAGYELALREFTFRPEVLAPIAADECLRARNLFCHLLRTGRDVFQPGAERFALRLGRTLSARPRLTPSREELQVIADYLSSFVAPDERCSELMQELSPLWQVPASRQR